MMLPGGQRLFNTRMGRRFSLKRTESEVLLEIARTTDIGNLEQILMRNDFCDYCSFEAINLKTALMLANTVVKISYKYPRLRSVFCFIGSKIGYLKSLQELCKLNPQTIREYAIEGMLTDSSLINVASAQISVIDKTEYDKKEFNVWAQAFGCAKFLDAVILDEKDFSGFGYMKLCRDVARCVDSGYHPVGCDKPESVIIHELGHSLDNLCGITSSREFSSYYQRFTKEQIKRGVSIYATNNAQEFFAEAFAEYFCSNSPRQIARDMGEMLERSYKKIG